VIILGIDPGTAVTGYGVIESAPGNKLRLIECGVIRTPARDPLPVRLLAIRNGMVELMERHHPDAVAVEDVFLGKNLRTTVVLAHARGAILLTAEEAGVPIGEYPPALVKKAVVGRGGAAKPQVGYMVAQLLRLAAPPTPADAADGVAVALAHHILSGHKFARPAARRPA
jgi:crossover junction endodeoxyribonuclease RuvC